MQASHFVPQSWLLAGKRGANGKARSVVRANPSGSAGQRLRTRRGCGGGTADPSARLNPRASVAFRRQRTDKANRRLVLSLSDPFFFPRATCFLGREGRGAKSRAWRSPKIHFSDNAASGQCPSHRRLARSSWSGSPSDAVVICFGASFKGASLGRPSAIVAPLIGLCFY